MVLQRQRTDLVVRRFNPAPRSEFLTQERCNGREQTLKEEKDKGRGGEK